MKAIKEFAGSAVLAAVLGAGLLAACGGGGDDEAGSPTSLTVQPAEVTFKVPTDTDGVCFGGGTQDVFVYGGAAPYRVDNTLPAYVNVDKTTVDSRGGHFTVTVRGGCFDTGTIVVVDRLDNQVVFKVTNAASAAS